MVTPRSGCLRKKNFYSNAQGSTLEKWLNASIMMGYETVTDAIICESEIYSMSKMARRFGFGIGAIRSKLRILGIEPKGTRRNLSREQIIYIRSLSADDYISRKLSKKIGFSHVTINNARIGRTYKNVV